MFSLSLLAQEVSLSNPLSDSNLKGLFKKVLYNLNY